MCNTKRESDKEGSGERKDRVSALLVGRRIERRVALQRVWFMEGGGIEKEGALWGGLP